MSEHNSLAHFLHDAGLAAWFGGSLMGAIGVNGAAAGVDDPGQRARVAASGWSAWAPVGAVAISAHLLGGAQLRRARKGRGSSRVTLALTAGALGATTYAQVLGQQVAAAEEVAGATSTPPGLAKAQKQLKALQWAVPGLTGAVLALSSTRKEPRPSQLLLGTLHALPSRAAGTVGALAGTAGVVGGRAAHAAVPVVGKAAHAAGTAYEKAYEKAYDKARDALPIG